MNSIVKIVIVVVIIIIMGVINYFVFGYSNSLANDVEILSEINQIRSGLEVYLANNNHYPIVNEPVLLNDPYSSTEVLCVDQFKKADVDCDKLILSPVSRLQDVQYYYQSVDNNLNYRIEFTLEHNFKDIGLLKGKNCASNKQIINQPCF